jgi:dipeptidyl aminopeptidase/acylaminoacyl peptidase
MKINLLLIQCAWLLLITNCATPPSTPTLVTETPLPSTTSIRIQQTDTPPPQATVEQLETETPTVAPPTPTAPFQAIYDLPYATSLQPEATTWNLDIYAPNNAADSPVVVFAHGFKAVKEGHKRESRVLAEHGAVVYTITRPTWIFDLAERERGQGYREMSEVLTCAIRYARSTALDYGGDPDRVILVGFSMGAIQGSWVSLAGENLAPMWDAFAAEQGGPPQQVRCAADEGAENVDVFIGIGGNYYLIESLQEGNEALWKIASPLAHIGQSPNLVIRLLHGERDDQVNPESSIQFNEVLAEAGYDSELILYDGIHLVPAELTAKVVMGLAGE